MDTKAYYTDALEKVEKRRNELKNKKSFLGWMRFGSIVAIFLGFYLLWSIGAAYAITAGVLFLIIFLYFVRKDIDNLNEIKFADKKIELYKKEIEGLEHFPKFPSGEVYKQKDHPYSDDLDIFGEGSLFQYINRTNSDPGSDTLAAFFSDKATIATINDRQSGIKELRDNEPEWLKEFQTTGALHIFTNSSKERLLDWVQQKNQFITFKPWAWLRFLLPAISIGVTVLWAAGIVNVGVFLLTLFIMAVFSWQINKYVAPIHRTLDDISKQFSSLPKSISMIESRAFTSPALTNLQSKLLANGVKASHEIGLVQKILERLDLRYNIVISFPLNLLLLWDLQQVLSLEKWKLRNQDRIHSWFDAYGQIEALVSLSIFSFNHQDYVFPTVSDDYFTIKGTNIGHPLITNSKRVDNPINIQGNGQLMLVTGSNMAGKSTYLRSIGVNCVLAFCGAPVCASEFQVSLVSLISSMRIVDDLQESTSTFYAELKKLKRIIDRVNNNDKLLILLDEILRGTNSMDRHSGSKALISQLIQKKSTAIVATHDLELAKLEMEYPDSILNFHFDVQVENEELFFDYKLKPGVCKSMNASILMKKIGIEM